MNIKQEIETLSAALKNFERAFVSKFRSNPQEAEEIAQVAENAVGDHPLVKQAIDLARDKAQQEANVEDEHGSGEAAP